MTRDIDTIEVERLRRFAAAMKGVFFDVCVADQSSNCSRIGFVTAHFGKDDLNMVTASSIGAAHRR